MAGRFDGGGGRAGGCGCAGMRRRGYPPEAIRNFCEKIGVAKSNSTVEFPLLEFCVREELNTTADRAMAVIDPLKVIITNYPAGQSEELPADNNLEKEDGGTRLLHFTRELYIEQSDFMEEPIKGFHRLMPGGEVRLKYAYIIRCDEVIKDEAGKITELHCSYDPNTRSGNDTSGKKVKGTIHWVDAASAVPAELRLYDCLFAKSNPDDTEEGEDFTDFVSADSLVVKHALLEASLADAPLAKPYQFMRQGYFIKDKDSGEGNLIFNRIVTMKDSWNKKQK